KSMGCISRYFRQPSSLGRSCYREGPIPLDVLSKWCDFYIQMKLNDLLLNNSIDPQSVLVLRHRPKEPELRRILPWLAGERPDLFNAYQQTQYEKLER